MRYIFITPTGIADSSTGELLDIELLEEVLLIGGGGVICGNNLYSTLAQLIPMVRRDEGWSAKLKLQNRRKPNTGRAGGAIYFTSFTYRFPKVRHNGKRTRPKSIKWLVINLELFLETKDVSGAAKALVSLAERRGIAPRSSPGSFGGALLRGSPAWNKRRQPAPWFISEIARTRLPGNYYALRAGAQFRCVEKAVYLDQRSAHHHIAASIPLPNPAFLRARGRLRAVEKGYAPSWIDDVSLITGHVGLLCAVVRCHETPVEYQHLLPPWARRIGVHRTWIWTPELKLMNQSTELIHISACLTSFRLDPALREFAEWSLFQLEHHNHPAIKSALLAAYGLLAVRTDRRIENYSVSGQPPKDSSVISLPVIGECFRSVVKNVRVPSIQNVVARGVIEAETRTRSIEYARYLEYVAGVPVTHIYADGLIAEAEKVPAIFDGWRLVEMLSNIRSVNPSTIISEQMSRTPGIPRSNKRPSVLDKSSSV